MGMLSSYQNKTQWLCKHIRSFLMQAENTSKNIQTHLEGPKSSWIVCKNFKSVDAMKGFIQLIKKRQQILLFPRYH